MNSIYVYLEKNLEAPWLTRKKADINRQRKVINDLKKGEIEAHEAYSDARSNPGSDTAHVKNLEQLYKLKQTMVTEQTRVLRKMEKEMQDRIDRARGKLH